MWPREKTNCSWFIWDETPPSDGPSNLVFSSSGCTLLSHSPQQPTSQWLLLHRVFIRGLVILWTAWPLKTRISPTFLSTSEKTRTKTTKFSLRSLFCFVFFWRGKIFIFKLRFFVHSLLSSFSPLLVHPIAKIDTPNNALNVPRLIERTGLRLLIDACFQHLGRIHNDEKCFRRVTCSQV